MDPQDTSHTEAIPEPQVATGQFAMQQPQGMRPDETASRMAFERPKAPGLHPMVVLQPGESVVAEIKRHPFGIILLYISALIGITVAAVLALVLVPDLLKQSSFNNMSVVYAIFSLVVLLVVLVLGVATSVYWQNQWIITTDSVTQITQNSLFDRQVAQLSMENLEDVTVNQDGILPHLFNYGSLKVETAGERSKFVFHYCPDPTAHARQILEIHEHFLEERRNVQHRI